MSVVAVGSLTFEEGKRYRVRYGRFITLYTSVEFSEELRVTFHQELMEFRGSYRPDIYLRFMLFGYIFVYIKSEDAHLLELDQ